MIQTVFGFTNFSFCKDVDISSIEFDYGDEFLHPYNPFVITEKKLTDEEMKRVFGKTVGYRATGFAPQYLVSHSDLMKIISESEKILRNQNNRNDEKATIPNKMKIPPETKLNLTRASPVSQMTPTSKNSQHDPRLFCIAISIDGISASPQTLTSVEVKPVFKYMIGLSDKKYEDLHSLLSGVLKVYINKNTQ